ncbi:MAG: GNAT family N-acetyltransferase [Proteobacteria bacterium]|nr:GNAT family N-acetyltransferase [Pseudomonadota bacterium]
MLTVIESSDAAFQQHWHTLLDNDPLQNPLYKSKLVRRRKGRSVCESYTDRSFVVVAQDKPVFGCSLTLHTDEQGRKCLGYFGLDAYTHVNRSSLSAPSNNFNPEAIRLLQHHIQQLLDEERPEAVDFLDPVSCGVMSPMTEVLLQKGARPTVHKVEIVDLTKPTADLLAAVSPAYREMLAWGQDNLKLNVVYSDRGLEDGVLDQLDAGTLDSSLNYLGNCLELLRQGQGFLVQADMQGKLVASALCVYSQRTCQFVSGESLTEEVGGSALPVLVWRAIQEAKALGCKQFDFGIVLEREDVNPQQFGGLTHTRLKITL